MSIQMMHSLTLNEDVLVRLPEEKKSLYFYEWMKYLDKKLPVTAISEIINHQDRIVQQLLCQTMNSPGPAVRKYIGKIFVILFKISKSNLLFFVVAKLNDLISHKGDTPSFLHTRIAAIHCLGALYENCSHIIDKPSEKIILILIQLLYVGEAETRIEILRTLKKMSIGKDDLTTGYKDIYKTIKRCLTDRVIAVRCAASECLLELLKYRPLLFINKLNNFVNVCFRAFINSDYEVRCSVGKLIGAVTAATQRIQQSDNMVSVSLQEALHVLMSGFLRGAVTYSPIPSEMSTGNTMINKAIRVGVTYAYLSFVQTMGPAWLQRNLVTFLNHVFQLITKMDFSATNPRAVYSRQCVNFILRNTFGKMLNEYSQMSACKEIALIIIREMNSINFNLESVNDEYETFFQPHLLMCALEELGELIFDFGSKVCNLMQNQSKFLIDTVVNVLVHPCYAARAAASWCLRIICIAFPCQIVPIIDRCIYGFENLHASMAVTSGFSCALAAVMSNIMVSDLDDTLEAKCNVVFDTAEVLLQPVNLNSHLALCRIRAGWLLLGSVMKLGTIVNELLPRMMRLLHFAFPCNTSELKIEQKRTDMYAWQVALEHKAGALSAIQSFVYNCPELATDDITAILLVPIESALTLLMNYNFANFGDQLKTSVTFVRLRLYETLLLFQPQAFEDLNKNLLKLICSEFIFDRKFTETVTSLLRPVSHAENTVMFNSKVQDPTRQTLENQLVPYSPIGSGSLENDLCCLYRGPSTGEMPPTPFPLQVAAVDNAIALFGHVYPGVGNENRVTILNYFINSLQCSTFSERETIQINVFAAILSGLNKLLETKAKITSFDVKKQIVFLSIRMMKSNNTLLRFAACETIGLLTKIEDNFRFTFKVSEMCSTKLKDAIDIADCTGHSLALGCMHRYMGDMNSNHHVATHLYLLFSLAKDDSSPITQLWSLQALAMMDELGENIYRRQIEPVVGLVLKLLMIIPESRVDFYQCIRKIIISLIITMGKTLQENSSRVINIRSLLLSSCTVLTNHYDRKVQADGEKCLQVMHFFAPDYIVLRSNPDPNLRFCITDPNLRNGIFD